MVRCLNESHGDGYAAYLGDCVDVLSQLPADSIDFSVYSPPFSGLYIYNDSAADMGNTSDDDEFVEQYRHMVRELHRIMRPGRIVAVHCKDLVYYQNQGGTAGLRDFPGMLIREHIDAGFDFHSRVTVWRCPVREMTKTKARGLLYKQLRSDSTYSRQGLPEYFVVFRKWAKSEESAATVEPVTHTHESFPLPQWQEYASPVWMDTRETDVLNAHRAERDEKHICPLPLDLIHRCVTLWSNPGDTVLSPFMGIGSEGFVSLKQGRKFVGVELKESYWKQAVRNLESVAAQPELFAAVAK
jgi:DNA modification methylase